MKTIILMTLMLLSMPGNAKFSGDNFVDFNNNSFHYSILIPDNWEKHELNLLYKHVMIVSIDTFTEIKITATKADDEEKNKWVSFKDWYIKGLGTDFKLIIEKEKFVLNKNTTSRLLVVQYRFRRKKILKRIIITNSDDYIIIVECSSPIKTFYKYEKTFNRVMRSIRTGL